MTPILYAKAIGAAVLAASLFLAGRSCERRAGDAEVRALKQAHAEATAKAERKARDLAEQYRAREQEQAQRFVDLSTEHHRKLRDVQAKADAVVAGLRAGNVRLRGEWAACVSRTPEAGPGAGGPDDAADVLPAGIGRVLGIVGACQAHVESLQSVLTAERQ